MSENIHWKLSITALMLSFVRWLSLQTVVHHLRPVSSSSLRSVLCSRAGRPSVCWEIRADYHNLDWESKSKVRITLSLRREGRDRLPHQSEAERLPITSAQTLTVAKTLIIVDNSYKTLLELFLLFHLCCSTSFQWGCDVTYLCFRPVSFRLKHTNDHWLMFNLIWISMCLHAALRAACWHSDSATLELLRMHCL